MKEAKKYKLRATRKPIRHQLLSGVVHVCDQYGRRPSYFSFSEDFVDAVGRALPQGLSVSRPGFVKVIHIPGKSLWRVVATYLDPERNVLLWETDTQPAWSKPV